MATPPLGVSKAVSWDAFLSTYFPAFLLALGTGIVLPSIPALAQSFDVSFGVASGVITAFLIGNLAGTLPSGWLIDRFGRRPVIIAGPLLTAATSVLIVFAESFTQLLILRFLSGCAAQMWLMGRLAAISHGAAAGERGRQVSWMYGMDSVGKLSGPLLGAFIATAWGTRAGFVVYAVLALIALIPTVLFAEDTPRHKAKEKAPASRKLSLREIVMPRLPYFGVALFAGLARGPIYADLLHLYAAFAYQLGPAQIGFLATGAIIINLPIAFAAGWLMDHFGRKRTMVPGFSGVGITMAALAVCAFIPLSYSWYVVLFFLAVRGARTDRQFDPDRRRRRRSAGSTRYVSRPLAPYRPGWRHRRPHHIRRDRGNLELRLVVPLHRSVGRGGGLPAYLLRAGDPDDDVTPRMEAADRPHLTPR